MILSVRSRAWLGAETDDEDVISAEVIRVPDSECDEWGDRYLLGDRITEAGRRLFTTLIRFGSVCAGHYPTRIVPKGPELDLTQPHGRG